MVAVTKYTSDFIQSLNRILELEKYLNAATLINRYTRLNGILKISLTYQFLLRNNIAYGWKTNKPKTIIAVVIESRSQIYHWPAGISTVDYF